jgi:ABC-type multidrug transport system fused ATPase/permease subunit
MVETEKLRLLRRTILFQDENNPKLMRLFGSLVAAAPEQAEKIEAAIRAYLDFNYPAETAEILWEAVAQYREAGAAFDAALQALKGVWDKRASIFLAIKVCEMLRPADPTLNVFLRRVAVNLDLSSQDAAVVRLVAGAATDSSTIQTSSAAQKFKVGPKASPETFLVPQLGDAVDVVFYLGDFFVASADEGAQLNGKALPPKFAVRFGLLDELKSGSFYLFYRDLQFLQRWFRSGRFQPRQFQLKQEGRPILEEVGGQASGSVLTLRPTTLTVRGDAQTTQLNWQDSIAIEGKTLAVEDLVPLMLADMSAPLVTDGGGTETPRCVLEVENMSCLFGKKPGLTDITFSAAGGQMIAVMGPSGCGKSTLLGTITGTIPIIRGQIRLNGEDLGTLVKAEPGRLGFVPQDDVLFDTLTASEKLRFGAQLRVAASQADNLDPIVDHVLDEIDLKERANVLVGGVTKKTLSGGQRKRLNIGLEFLSPKPVMLLDEPTSGLSSADAERILQILRSRADAGTLVMVVIHQPSATLFRLFDGYCC